MIYRRIFLTIITSLSYCLSFASYDGRLADDLYHKSPTWLYLVIFIAVVCGIVKAISKKKGNYTNVQKSKAKKYKKTLLKSIKKQDCIGTNVPLAKAEVG